MGEKRLYIPREELVSMWGNNTPHIKRLTTPKGLALYLTNINKINWRLYPENIHIFSRSSGIKKPIPEETTYKEAKELVSDMTLDFASTTTVFSEDDDGVRKEHNVIVNESYSKKSYGKKYPHTMD